MSEPDGRFTTLLPKAEGSEPVFQEPWQATAFALVVALHARGQFSWPDWASALARELGAGEAAAGDGAHYYDHWLKAIEKLVCARGLSDQTALDARKEAWAEAYRRTPHGHPVEL